MYLQALEAAQFRNLAALKVSFSPEGAFIVGGNGQGKTNLLEAMYYLSVFRSFRGAQDRQLVTFGAEHFRLVGHVCGGDDRPTNLSVACDGQGKRVTVNGRGVERLSDVVGALQTVAFLPGDTTLIQGPPAERRQYLDRLCSVLSKRYLIHLHRYRETLAQKNRLLQERWGTPETLAPWEAELQARGGRILAERLAHVGGLNRDFQAAWAGLAGGEAELTYRASLSLPDELDVEGLTEALGEAISSRREQERQRGMALVGPHRDDLKITVDGRDLRIYGSQGEQRSAVIALRLAEGALMARIRREPPVYLVDDVFAELDGERSGRLAMLLSERGQVIFTSPRIEDRVEGLPVYRIDRGQLRAAD